MPTQTSNLFLLEDLEDVGKTTELAESDLDAHQDGARFGPYYEGNEGTAIYNLSLRPCQSPVPFPFVRHGVTSDWKFFLDDEEWLNLWARRYGESAVQALAEELRRLPWRVGRTVAA